MRNSFRGRLAVDDVKLTLSSAYEDDFLIIQQANNCIVLDITDDTVKLDIRELLMSLEFRDKKDIRRKNNELD